MRRLALISAVLAVLAAPAGASAAHLNVGDGQLVVKGANAGSQPYKTPVVSMTITSGAVLGYAEYGRIVVDQGANPSDTTDVEVTGADWRGHSQYSDTAQVFGGSQFHFRIVAGSKVTVLVFGTGVDLFAVGRGVVKLNGADEAPSSDGVFSLNGNDFHSLPAQPTTLLLAAASG